MEQNIQERMLMEKSKEKAVSNGKMVQNTRVNSMITIFKELELINGLTIGNTLANG